MKRLGIAMLVLLVCPSVLSAQVERGICTIQNAPAATLLLPYFEVDLAQAQGANTLFTVNNASNRGVVGHVTLWTDLSVPTLDFNVYLTGYDAVTFDLRDLFVNGLLPQTASDGQDPADTISPQGAFSQDVNVASCSGQLPLPQLPPFFISHIQNAHTGLSSPILGGCSGRALGDRVARGYVTVDVVDSCTLLFPTDVGYFGAGGTGVATNDNVLWGDVLYLDRRADKARSGPVVTIEASGGDPETSTAGGYTFYGRYAGWSAADNREPLGTNYGIRYRTTNRGTTDLIVWRDSKVAQTPFVCGNPPAALGQEEVAAFDDEENPEVISGTPFPAESQRVAVGGAALPVSFDSGWLFANLNHAGGGNPSEDPAAAQGWVSSIVELGNRFTIGSEAVQLDSACDANHRLLSLGGPVEP